MKKLFLLLAVTLFAFHTFGQERFQTARQVTNTVNAINGNWWAPLSGAVYFAGTPTVAAPVLYPGAMLSIQFPALSTNVPVSWTVPANILRGTNCLVQTYFYTTNTQVVTCDLKMSVIDLGGTLVTYSNSAHANMFAGGIGSIFTTFTGTGLTNDVFNGFATVQVVNRSTNNASPFWLMGVYLRFY